MECNKVIPIRNVFYMLSYAFQVLNENGYKKLGTEEFSNAGDMCAAILIKGVNNQIRRGLRREYVSCSDSLSALKGRINITESIKQNTLIKHQMVCSFDDFSPNCYLNKIVYSTLKLLLKANISSDRKRELRKILVYFDGVEELDIHRIEWHVQYDKNNQNYRMLISICYLVVKGLIQTTSEGTIKMMDFFDEQRMCRLYEKFILEYYRKHFPSLCVNASQIEWALDEEDDDSLLPVMKTDITIENRQNNRILVIDAKYYSSNLQEQYNKYTIHSNNLYQIFTYVKNLEALYGNEKNISGMLLYARTTDAVQPNGVYHMSGNIIAVNNLDLDVEFENIANALNRIAEEYLF